MFGYQKTTLDNKLRIVTIPKPDSPSATVMVLVGVGSRYEKDKLAGISHFIEHNVFKGTVSRPHRNQIAQEIEGLGGITNAGTGHEFTNYWAKAAASQVNKILDVVMDISLNMSFPEEDVVIERGNVIEEMNMYHDNPRLRIFDAFLEFVWEGDAIGRKVIGRKEVIQQLTRGQMLSFVKRNYIPERMVIIAAGDIKIESIKSQVTAHYGDFVKPREMKDSFDFFTEFQTDARVYLDQDKTQQTHFCLGLKTFGRQDERKYVLNLMNAILGQGLSSRLFNRIRNEMGLAYYIHSVNYEYDDTGVWFVLSGVDTKRVDKAIPAVLDEFQKLGHDPVSEIELRKAKEYVKGRTLLGVETSDDLGEWYGFQELLEKEVLSPQEYNEKIEAVTAQQIQSVAQGLLKNDRLNLGIVGPFEDKERFLELLKL